MILVFPAVGLHGAGVVLHAKIAADGSTVIDENHGTETVGLDGTRTLTLTTTAASSAAKPEAGEPPLALKAQKLAARATLDVALTSSLTHSVQGKFGWPTPTTKTTTTTTLGPMPDARQSYLCPFAGAKPDPPVVVPPECPCNQNHCADMWNCFDLHYTEANEHTKASCDKVREQKASADDEKCCKKLLELCRDWLPKCYYNLTKSWFPETMPTSPEEKPVVKGGKGSKTPDSKTSNNEQLLQFVQADSRGLWIPNIPSEVKKGLARRNGRRDSMAEINMDDSLSGKCAA